MKKFLTIISLILAMFLFVSCLEDEEEEDTTDTVSGDTGSDPSDTGSTDTDTTPSDTTDTSDSNHSGDTGADTGSADTGSADTGSADTGSADTGSADTGSADTGSADTGDTGSADTGDTDNTPSDPVNCTGISIVPDSFDSTSTWGIYRAEIKEVLGSDSKTDELEIKFRRNDDETLNSGSYSLTYDPANTTDAHNNKQRNYNSCLECVSVFQDGEQDPKFFQKSGTLNVEEVDESNRIKGSLTAKLEEVTIAESDGASVPVPNGACLEIETAFDNLCKPSCKTENGKDKICGSNGCGGSCGTCTGENEGCSADQTQCIPYECTKITVNDLSLSSKPNQLEHEEFFYVSSFKEGDSPEVRHDFWLRLQGLSMMKETDLSTMTFLGNCKGETSLGDKTDGWPEQNSVCIYIKDISDSNKFYFPTQGTINITTLDSSGKLEAALSGIRLVNINTTDGIPVAGGKCFEITNDSFHGN